MKEYVPNRFIEFYSSCTMHNNINIVSQLLSILVTYPKRLVCNVSLDRNYFIFCVWVSFINLSKQLKYNKEGIVK